MDKIIENLTRDYKSSIDFFNHADYNHFFSDIRLSIEWFLKLMIHEVLESESLANAIIEGKDSFSLDRASNRWKLAGKPQQQEPEGAFFVQLLKNAMFYKHPQIWESTEKKTYRLKKYCETSFDKLSNYYSVASELQLHTGSTQLDLPTQAKGCAGDFSTIFDQIKSVFPKTYTIFCSLPKPDLAAADKCANSLEENLETLYKETNNFCTNGGDKFIILLPSSYEIQDKSVFDALTMIPCSLVCDLSTKNGKDISSAINNDIWTTKIHPVKTKDDFVVGSTMTNWYFCRGQENVGEPITFDFKNWKVNKSKQLLGVLTNIAKKNNSSHFFILNFINEPKYAPYIFEQLNTVFGDEIHTRNRCDIFSFTNNPEVISGLKEWANDSVVSHNFFNITIEDFLIFVKRKSKKQIGSENVKIKSRIIFSQEEISIYREAGIDIFGLYFVNSTNKFNFYYGAEITWQELAFDFDVKRNGYEKFKQNIVSIIKNPKQKTITYTLKHHPGAGGTTMSRRLAYDLCKLNNELEDFSCLPLFLNSFNEKTYEYLLQLSEKKMDNDFLVIIVEGGKVADENINKLSIRLNSRQRNIVILRVFRTTRQNIQGGLNVTTLSSYLTEDDAKLFVEKYSNVNNRQLFTEEEVKNGLEVVDFPLKLNDDITSDRLNDYVGAFMNDMPENLKYFVGYIAFTTYYADRSLNQNLVKSLYHEVTTDYEWVDTIRKLIIQESDEEDKLSGCWRPRYQSFALPILNKVWGMDWRLRVSQIAVNFLKECEKIGTIGLWDKDMLYGVFVLRRGSDFKDSVDEERSKFAKLIQDIMSNDQRPEEIYNALVDTYPDDAVFLGHYGRYLYEQAFSKKVLYNDELYMLAENLISQAIELSPNADDNYHMMGMLNLRKIQSIENCIAKIKNDSSYDFYDFEDLIQKWMLQAKKNFEESIERNQASPYGFTAQCQLYCECLKLSKLLKDADDYSFCDNDPIYIDMIEFLGNSLNQLGNICQTYDEGQTYMVQSMRTYNRIRAFHRQVIGNPQAAVDHYRKLYESSTSSNKSFYGKQFVTSVLYARTEGLKTNRNRNNMVWAMGHLSTSDRIEVSRVLQYQRSQNDMDSYESIFWYKMSGNEEFSLDEAVNLLIEWLHQYEINRKNGGGKLKAAYYLAVCYSAMAINSNSYNEDYIRNAKKYFKLAGELAESFEKSALSAFSYMGEEYDAHCILQPSQIDEARVFEVVISKIERRKGWVKLPCGLEAFFPASDFNSLADEGKTYLRGKIGFRYSGLGLYQFSKVTENSVEQLAEISDYCDKEIDNQNNIPVGSDNLSLNYVTSSTSTPQPKIVGKIDLTQFETRTSKKTKVINDLGNYKDGEIVHGIINGDLKYVKGPKGFCTIDNKNGFAISPKDCDYEAIKNVVFKVKIGKNKNDPSLPWYYAINIQPDE